MEIQEQEIQETEFSESESGIELLLKLRKQIQILKALISQKDSEIDLHKNRITEMEISIKEIISLSEN